MLLVDRLEEEEMKSKFSVYLFVALVLCSIVILIVYYYLFEKSSEIPTGVFKHAYLSPNKQYTLNIYLIEADGLSNDSARGELFNNKSKVKKNIYWNYPDANPYVQWLDNKRVIIGDKTLNIAKGEVYDWTVDKNKNLSDDHPRSLDIPRQANK